MDFRKLIESWPVYRQLTGDDTLGRGKAAQSKRSLALTPRTAEADHVTHSVCPFCAVGCAQKVYVKDEKVVQIEGNPDSPISRGRLCPKGSASKQLVTSPSRVTTVRYRRPHGTEWEDLDLDTAVDMIADRVIDARRMADVAVAEARPHRRAMPGVDQRIQPDRRHAQISQPSCSTPDTVTAIAWLRAVTIGSLVSNSSSAAIAPATIAARASQPNTAHCPPTPASPTLHAHGQ